GQPELVAGTFGIDATNLPAKAVSDPRAAVAVDAAHIKANPFLPADFIVSGLVYDVRTGLIETVVAPSRLGDGAPATAARARVNARGGSPLAVALAPFRAAAPGHRADRPVGPR